MTKRRMFGLAIIALVLVSAGVLIADEVRLRRPKRGMMREDVRSALGRPSEMMNRAEIDRYHLPIEETCRKETIAEAYIYGRKFRESLYVYFDAAGRVQCTERAMTFSIITQ
jgi:outer membrane protein assembly factor BamE (lipoprotein component of BamABCDE complex)